MSPTISDRVTKIEAALCLNSESESITNRVSRIERYILRQEGMAFALKVILGFVLGDSGLLVIVAYWVASGRH